MDVEKTVREIVLDILEVSESQVVLEANIVTDLGASSVQIVDLVAAAENEFDVRFSDEEIIKLRTVGDVVRYIQAGLSK